MGLNIRIAPSALDAAVTLWRLEGHLDAETVPELEARFEGEVREGRVRWVVDLEALEYISSAGLGSFVGVLSELRARGGDIVFAGLGPKFEKTFRVLGFLRIFRAYPAESEAVAALGRG